MAHHKIGDVGDGELGSWGFPAGGMGGVTRRVAQRGASRSAPTVRTDAPCRRASTCATDGRAASRSSRARSCAPTS